MNKLLAEVIGLAAFGIATFYGAIYFTIAMIQVMR